MRLLDLMLLDCECCGIVRSEVVGFLLLELMLWDC